MMNTVGVNSNGIGGRRITAARSPGCRSVAFFARALIPVDERSLLLIQ
jgi:hypothetical protein